MRPYLTTLATAAAMLLPAAADAETTRLRGALPVDEAIARVGAAVDAAGAQVFLIVDFQDGNARVGETLRPTKLILFGSPKIGAAALQDAQAMGLFVPLRLLAYEDADGATWLAYPVAREAAAEHGLDPAHRAVARMQAAMERMAAVAAGN